MRRHLKEIAQVAGACTFVLGSLLACGFQPPKTVGAYKNPSFDGKAPGPTLVTTMVDCSESGASAGHGGVAADFQAMLNKKIGQQQKVSVGFQSKEILCSTLATDKMLSPNVNEKEAATADYWRSRPAFGELTERAGTQYGVKSLLIPVVYRGKNCSRDTETLRDGQGRVIATSESSHVTCAPSGTLDLSVFLVKADDGTILWKASGSLYGDQDHTKELDQMLATMPSASADGAGSGEEESSSSDVAMKETSSKQSDASASALTSSTTKKSAAPKVSATEADFKPILSKIASTAPEDCRTFAKTSCERSQGAAATREQICQSYVNAVNVVAKQSTAKSTCSAMLKNVPKS